MGSKSTSVTASQTTYNTETNNLNLQDVEAGQLIAGNKGTVNVLDGGAIKGSLGLASQAIGGAFKNSSDVLGFSNNVLNFSGDLVEGVINKSMEHNRTAFGAAVSALKPDSAASNQGVYILVAGVAALGLIAFMAKGK